MARDRTRTALVFDVGGVLLAHDNEHLFRTLASRCTAPGAAAAHIRERTDNIGLAAGRRPVSDVHAQLVAELGYSGDWEAFKRDWCCHFTLDESMIGLADRLAACNRFMLFSNTNAVHREFQRDIFDRFESYASHEIGDAKPAESAFNKVSELAEIDPARSIFIDDLSENVEAARRFGFTAHQFINQPTLEQFLRDAGINWTDDQRRHT